MADSTYISLVATTRNDNHGGDLLKRTICFINSIYHQAKQYDVPTELIIVEWNPPKDKPLLKDVLPHPPEGCPVSLRIVVVPDTLHQQYRFYKKIPLYQMIAKNVGIKRAKGEFILCTNIDLIFPGEVFQLFKERSFKKNCYYRANRCDVPKDVMDIKPVDEQVKYCKQNIENRLGYRKIYHFDKFYPNFPYQLFPNLLWRFDDLMTRIFKRKAWKSFQQFKTLDTLACGDFTLMHREDWERIHGYVELDFYSLHIDTMALLSARAVGMEQVNLPEDTCTYHIYHEDGWESNYKKPDEKIRLTVDRPTLDWFTVWEVGHQLIELGKPFDLNEDNWGFSDIELEEFIFGVN